MAVRKEEIRIHATSNLASVAAKDAAALRALSQSAEGLSRSAVQTDRDTRRMTSSLSDIDRSATTAGRGTRQAAESINQLTGRIRVLADVAAILGPALAPIGALAVPAVTGLANQLGFAAAAAGTAVLAFQGVGDAVTAMNEYALSPTADNAEKVQEVLAKLSPAAANFAREISSMRDQFAATRDAAAEGLFGGLTPALDDLDGLLGRVQPVLREIGAATGDMLADGLGSLNSDRWQPFFDFLQAEARPVLEELGHTVGDFGHGLAELWMAFQPLNRDFSGWLADVADGFDGWAEGLGQTEGFQDFMAYLRESGPQVASSLSALGGALIDVLQAAAPLGGPVLAGVEAFAEVISAVADSPLGPMLVTAAAGMALFNRAMAVGSRVAAGGFFATTAANARRLGPAISGAAASARAGTPALSQFGTVAYRLGQSTRYASDQTLAARKAVGAFVGSASRVALPMAGMALAMSETGQEMAFANTATYGLIGAMAGLPGALGGAALGAALDFAAANNDVGDAIERAQQIASNGSLKDMEAEYRRVGQLIQDQTGTWEGAFNDFASSLSQAAGMATGGFIGDEDAKTVSDLAREYDSLGGSIRRARDPMSGLAGLLTTPFNETDGAIRGAALSMESFVREAAALGRILSGETALIDYKQSIDDLAASLRENGNSFDYNTQKGRDNARALLDASGRAIEFSKTLKGFERVEFLRGVRSDLKGLVGDIPGADRLLGKVDRQLRRLGGRWAKPRVEPQGVREAERDIQGVDRNLRRLGGRTATPRADLNNNPFLSVWGITGNRLGSLDRRTATPRANLNNNPFLNIWGITSGRMGDLDRRTANPRANLQDNASGPIAGIQSGLNALRDKTVTVTVRSMRVNGTATANALGGFYPGGLETYAEGGMRSAGDRRNAHLPEFAGPGPTRMWREPETGGESYIPHANDHRRPRAMDIAEQTVALFGGQVEWYAQGGLRAAERAGVAAAMRTGGNSAVRVAVSGDVFVNTSDGRRIPLDLDARIDERLAAARSDDALNAFRESTITYDRGAE